MRGAGIFCDVDIENLQVVLIFFLISNMVTAKPGGITEEKDLNLIFIFEYKRKQMNLVQQDDPA